jgi:hypothetical protein
LQHHHTVPLGLSSSRASPLVFPGFACVVLQFRSVSGWIASLFAWLISHQPTVLFSQNKPVTSNQPTVLFSQDKSAPAISHQPNEQAVWVSVFGVLLWLKLGNAFWWRPALATVRKTGGNRSGSAGSWWNRSGSVHEPVRFPPPNRA